MFTKYDKYIEKQTIIVVQATPKTQPGGVQGDLFNVSYEFEVGPLFSNQLPIPSAEKYIRKNNTNHINCSIIVVL